MLNLGELYYYDNVIDDQIPFRTLLPLGVEDRIDWHSYDELTFLNSIKDVFISEYTQLLRDSGLNQALQVWDVITDIYVSKIDEGQGGANETNLINKIKSLLNEWIIDGQNYTKLGHLLEDIRIECSPSLEAFSIYYGIKVLHTITENTRKLYNTTSDYVGDRDVDGKDTDENIFDVQEIDKMLALCPDSLSSLFNSNGIETITNIDNITQLINALEGVIRKDQLIKLIISYGVPDSSIILLKKHFKNKLIFCKIPQEISTSDTTNYFASLALRTIGLSESIIKSDLEKKK